MKKISGKALSLVLSLALVVSSFSVSLASAATTSETATGFSLTSSTIYLSNGGTTTDGLTADVTSKFTGIASAELYDHQDVKTALALKEVVVTSGSGIASVVTTDTNTDGTIDTVKVTLANTNVTGTVTLAGRYAGTTTRPGSTDTVNVYATATVTVNVLQKGSAVIGKSGFSADGSYPASFDDFPKDSGSPLPSQTGSVYEVSPLNATSDATAHFVAAKLYKGATADPSALTDIDEYKVVVSPSDNVTLSVANDGDDTFSLAEKKVEVNTTTHETEPFARVGNIAIQAVKYVGNASPATSLIPSTTANTVVKIANKVVASATDKVIYQYRGGTYIGDVAKADSDTTAPAANKNVTGADVDISQTTGVTMQGGSVGTISGNKSFTLQDGTVYAVANSVASYIQNKGTVGNVGDSSSSGKIATTSIFGGKTGNIYAASVIVQSTDAKTPVVVGNISGATSITVDSNDKATVTVGNIASIDGTTILLKKSAVVGQINDNYYAATLTLDGFTGSLAAPTNVQNLVGSNRLAITSLGTTDAVITGAALVPSLNISGGTVYFADTVKVGSVYGAGTLKFNAGKLYATGNISGVSLRLANSFKVGDTVFQADAYKVYEGSFTPVGFTLEKVAGTTVDTFKVASVVFAGLNITGPTADQTIAVNATQTYTADSYPAGTSLPAGDTVQWSFDGNSDYFTFASTGNKATLTAKKIDTTFPSLNVGTLTASVVDQYGFKVYGYTDATYKVTIATKSFTSDTTGDVKMNVGGTYQFKITSLDGTVPPFGLGGNGAAVTSSSVSGKDYFYKVTANKAGDYGVYVNGTRVAILRVSAVSAKIDTTVVTIKVGNTYQFKVTSAAKPNFGLGSSALQTVATSSKGQDYFYKVKAVSGKTGDKVGVYVNGTRAAIATIG